MSNDPQPIPAHIWSRILVFLAARVNGQVVLNVHEGKVQAAEIREVVRAPKASQ